MEKLSDEEIDRQAEEIRRVFQAVAFPAFAGDTYQIATDGRGLWEMFWFQVAEGIARRQ